MLVATLAKGGHLVCQPGFFVMSLQRQLLTILVALLLTVDATVRADTSTAWAEKDTRLANEYLSMLVERPEYGRVVDLLWDLYRRHDATQLLLDNVQAQAAASKHPSVLLVEGHLLRKSGDLKRAAEVYESVLKQDNSNALASKSRADVASEMGDAATALALLRKLALALPDSDPAKLEAWMQLGNVALAAEKPEEAAAAWERAAKLKPQDMVLARAVAQLMLRAGFPERAAVFLETLVKLPDPQHKLDALFDLARVREHADDFAKADEALRQGLALLDFRDGRYGEFFLRRVRLHERFGFLDDLRVKLVKAARIRPPTEQALHDLARFYGITVEPEERLAALRELTRAAPDNDQYRWELVRALLDHDGAKEAATLLDERLKGDDSDLPILVQLRSEADLRQGRQMEAVDRLSHLLAQRQGDLDTEKSLLTFAQERSLDTVIEVILKRRIGRDSGKPEPVFDLATFYRTRDNTSEALTVLESYCRLAPNPLEHAHRLNDAAQFLATGGALDEALKLQAEAASLVPGGRDELTRLADLQAEAGNSAAALENLEAALPKALALEEMMDLDERLFSVLQGDQTEKAVKVSPATATGFQLPAFMTGQGFGSDDPPEGKSKIQFPAALTDYAAKVVASAKAPGADERLRIRGLWWAFHVERLPDCYELLRLLVFDPVTHARRQLPLEVDRLMLDVAIRDDNRLLAGAQLQRLVEADPANRVQYLLRQAEQRLADSQPDLAVKPLEAALKLQPDSENVLSALTQCYQIMRKQDKALALWREAISRTPGNGGTPLRERYAEMLLKAGKIQEYVETQAAIVEAETDIKRRREAFKRFLDRLLWSDSNGGEVAPQVMQSRLKMVEDRVLELTRRHPFDGFYHEALAAVFDKRGDAAKAFAAMRQAYYTSPDTPFSLVQLRSAALAVNDLKAAIYFQKQIAAAAPPKELANESRTLVQLLEQTFQIAEADRVRRHLENRLSQDAAALEDLAQYYKETGQDDAERRVYEQIQRVHAWDARSTLRLALKCVAVADESAALKHLRDLLARTQAKNSLRALPPDRWPFPLTDERKPGGAASLVEIANLLDGTNGLQRAEQERLRIFLGVPRPEFAELPDDPSLVRLRAIEELAKLLRRHGDAEELKKWLVGFEKDATASPVERLWALFYAGTNDVFQRLLTQSIGQSESLELQFVHAWLTVRTQGMKSVLVWMKSPKLGEEKALQRKRIVQVACAMLADWDRFTYSPVELTVLGNSKLLQPADLLGIVRHLQDRQRYAEAMTLVECIRTASPEMWRYYSFLMASFAQSAELWDRQRQYLRDVLDEKPQAGAYAGEGEDLFLLSVAGLCRLARTPQERDEAIKDALEKLRAAPPSPLTTMRLSVVQGLAGAVEPAARSMGHFIAGSFISGRTLGVPYGGLMPQGSVRMEEANFLRTYWEDLRLVGALLSQQGLGPLVAHVDDSVANQIGAVQLGPKPSDTFSGWRITHLVRRLRNTDFPNRVRMIREFLGSVNMAEEDAVETLTEVGRELEVNGFTRECIDIYRRLPGRAPTNNLYAEYFIRVCEQSWDPQPGREYVESLFGKDPLYKPQGIGDEVLREKHARFLALEFNADRLRQLAWKPEGFTRVLKGRVAHEVPYARELALLLEHIGDNDGALTAWDQAHTALINGTPDDPFPIDPETVLHRARLLEARGDHEKALKVLVEMPVKESLDEVRLQALELRAQVATGLNRWDDLRELMSLAVEKKSPELAVTITGHLREAGRPADALNFLTQAERAMKGGEERLVLRLEQLSLLALDPSWKPSSGRAKISAMFRTGGRKRETLQRMVEWFSGQAKSSTAKDWLTVLRAETRSSNDACLPALALASFASNFDSSGVLRELTQAWSKAEEKDRVCLELAAEALLRQNRPDLASVACDALKATPSGMQSRMLPVAVRVAASMKDESRLRELFSDVVRMPFPGGLKTVDWAAAFEEAGHGEWAAELYELAMEQMERTQKPLTDIIQAHVEFLVRRHDFEGAEQLLMKHYHGFIPQAAGLVLDLYRAWGRLSQLDLELPKFYLPSGVEREVRFQAEKK